MARNNANRPAVNAANAPQNVPAAPAARRAPPRVGEFVIALPEGGPPLGARVHALNPDGTIALHIFMPSSERPVMFDPAVPPERWRFDGTAASQAVTAPRPAGPAADPNAPRVRKTFASVL